MTNTNTFINSDIDKNDYTNFLKNTPSTFYHTMNHLRFLEELLHLKVKFVITQEDSTIKGILPFFIKESSLGSVVNSLPFFGSYGGVLTESEYIAKDILDEFNQFIKKNNVISATIISNAFNTNKLLYEKNFSHNIIEQRRIQCINLQNLSEKDLWNSLEQRVRRSIRKSLKENLEFSKTTLTDETISNFFELHQKEMNSKGGKPKPIEFFYTVKNNFSIENDYDVFEIKKNNKPISYLLVFYHYPFVEYYMPAYDSEFKNSQSTSLLIWESLKLSIKKNYHFYNFGGTWFDQPELHRFKRGWNADDYLYDYYVKADVKKIKDIGIEKLLSDFSYFYIVPFNKI